MEKECQSFLKVIICHTQKYMYIDAYTCHSKRIYNIYATTSRVKKEQKIGLL